MIDATYTRLRALPGPLVLAVLVPILAGALLSGLVVLAILASVGWALAEIDAAPTGLHVLGLSLLEACVGGFAVGMLAALFARRGGITLFRPDLALIAARGREAVWLLSGILVLAVTSRILFAAHTEGIMENADLAARLCLLTSALLMAMMFHRVGIQKLRQEAAADQRGRRRTWILVYVGVMLLPAAFVLLLVQGFLVGALDLTRSLLGTLLIIATAATVRAMITPVAGEHQVHRSAPGAGLRRGRDKLRHLVLLVVTTALLLWIWREVFVAFGYLQNVALWSAETASGEQVVTVANLLACVAVLAGTLIAFWGLPLVAGTQSLDTVSRGVGTRYAVVTLVRYVILLLGVLAAFTFLHIGWSKIQWLATGLSVGLGFGSQEIVANFFSGLILLSEGSIRVGDLVVVGVRYGSDTALVERLLVDAALQTREVLPDPAPTVAFESFGDSALQFRLYAWIAAAHRAVPINHLLHVRIEEALRVNGIVIPFPQRDLHLDTAAPLEIGAQAAD
jgi:small-conductance mechanosensitive channel